MNTDTIELHDETLRFTAKTRQPVAIDVAVANVRLLEVFNAMLKERWLPIALRTMIVHDLPMLRRALEGGRVRVNEMLRLLREIAKAAYGYGQRVLRSETISLVRSLEYELSNGRSAA